MAIPSEDLRTWRRRAGRTQRQVAATLGVTSQAVSLWEAGTRPGIDKIRALDVALEAGGELVAAYGVTVGGGATVTLADVDRKVDDLLELVRRIVVSVEAFNVADVRRRTALGRRDAAKAAAAAVAGRPRGEG